ncbi:uncharacterized protein DUF3305 [Vibrio diazotrophicus]|uniref:Uncharacterized protein DUF3305 n=2 Tax=Vibrio diazotrophicus TaxID=685 RepID=A0A329EHP0_VIBDI|nr:uncharacterized protein DUF3305 [Vibrio diazotrophicus]
MSEKQIQAQPLVAKQTMAKTENSWPISCRLKEHEITAGMWVTTQWQLLGFDLAIDENSQHVATLELYRDERTDYRFNLSSKSPKLFLILEQPEDGETPKIIRLIASQSVAGQYMDGEYLVLSNDMPLPVQAWMEAFIGRHGELLEVRGKKRKGAGRSSGQ